MAEQFTREPVGRLDGGGIAGGGTDEADIDLTDMGRPFPIELPLLEHALEADLHGEREGLDLSEVERASRGLLEKTGTLLGRAAPEACLTEEGGGKLFRILGRGVDRDERPLSSGTGPVDWRGRASPCRNRALRR